jgi:hypothetical protein
VHNKITLDFAGNKNSKLLNGNTRYKQGTSIILMGGIGSLKNSAIHHNKIL